MFPAEEPAMMEHYTIRLLSAESIDMAVKGLRPITTNPKPFHLGSSTALKVKPLLSDYPGIAADRAGLDSYAAWLSNLW